MKITVEIEVFVQGGHAVHFSDIRREVSRFIDGEFIDYWDAPLGERIIAKLDVTEIKEGGQP